MCARRTPPRWSDSKSTHPDNRLPRTLLPMERAAAICCSQGWVALAGSLAPRLKGLFSHPFRSSRVVKEAVACGVVDAPAAPGSYQALTR